MSSKRFLWLPTTLLILMTGHFGLQAEPAAKVVVLNLPSVQEVEGSVSVENLPINSRFLAKEAIIVPPVQRSETVHLVAAGLFEADGFRSAHLSLHVESQGKVTQEGAVGVLLVPDRKPILQSLNLEAQILLASELRVDLPTGSIPVASQIPFEIAFPRYRIYLYNETNATARADLYLYLSR